MKYQVEATSVVDCAGPGDALGAFLEELLGGGRGATVFHVREVGGRGGGVTRVVVAGEGEETPPPPAAGVSRTLELARAELVAEVLEVLRR